MQLVGMLDSPYVRRVAISLRLLGVPFEHRALSVFSTFAQFHAINPVVKAPSLTCDDGEVLMDSTLILGYAEALAGKTLMPSSLAHRQHALRIVCLALAAFVALETELRRKPLGVTSRTIDPAGIATAIAWPFTQSMLTEIVSASKHPRLVAFSTKAEALPEFIAFPPTGPGVQSSSK